MNERAEIVCGRMVVRAAIRFFVADTGDRLWVGFGIERVMRGLFLYGGNIKAILFCFGAFAVLGWLVFALPALVISPWRKRFRRAVWSGLVRGAVGSGC